MTKQNTTATQLLFHSTFDFERVHEGQDTGTNNQSTYLIYLPLSYQTTSPIDLFD